MTLPKISIVTPSYNQGKFLEETIQSVLSQDYPDFEYIVIDGGSMDESPAIIKKYESALAYWESKKDSGQSEAINKGFKRASGDIICWINSDDVLMPGALMAVGKFFQEHQNVDLVTGYTAVMDEASTIISMIVTKAPRKSHGQKGIFYVNQPATFWRRKLLDQVGYLREDFHAQMDKELIIRFMEKDILVGDLDRVLAGFRMHKAAKSNPGVINESWYSYDQQEIRKLYAAGYGDKPKRISYLLYGLEKLIQGLYLKKWLLIRKYKGRKISAV